MKEIIQQAVTHLQRQSCARRQPLLFGSASSVGGAPPAITGGDMPARAAPPATPAPSGRLGHTDSVDIAGMGTKDMPAGLLTPAQSGCPEQSQW